jgi:alpha-beta hydrolase superfamily lysophospholipase
MNRVRSQPEKFRTPVALFVSRDDKVIDWQAAEQFVKQCGAPVKEFKYYDYAGHALTVDRGWQQLTLDMADFFLND